MGIRFSPKDLRLIAAVQDAVQELAEHLGSTSDLTIEWSISSVDGEHVAGSNPAHGHDLTTFEG